MSKTEFRVLSIYVWVISIASMTLSIIGPLLASQIILFMLISGGLVLWSVIALMRKMDGE